MRLVLDFFFSSRRRHTRFKCDWSSDVCSSDLPRCATSPRRKRTSNETATTRGATRSRAKGRPEAGKIGKASWREREENSVVAGSFKKKKVAHTETTDILDRSKRA